MSRSRDLWRMLIAAQIGVLLGQPIAGAQHDWHVYVDDPRPLAAAVTHIETLCRCIVTYEDPRWTRDQVVDVTAQVRQDGRLNPQVFGPAGRPFEFWFGVPPSNAPTAQFAESFRDLLKHFHQSGNPGVFTIDELADVLHVTPDSGSVLDVPVSLPTTVASEVELIGALLRAVSTAQHTTIVMGIGTELQGPRIEMSAANETAASVLTRLLTQRTPHRSWRLLYDYGSQKYVFNVHAVR